MLTKKQMNTNFSRSVSHQSLFIRPDTEKELFNYLNEHKPEALLSQGSSLSYSDCGINSKGLIINTERLNHYVSFDSHSGLLVCQAGITFKELLNLHPEFIPPVIPGTLYATLGGALANDVHGKNNHQEKSFGSHVEWIELFIQDQLIQCSRKKNRELFDATIGGLGLTGIITRIALRLKKASHYVAIENRSFTELNPLLEAMSKEGVQYDYQVAWLDLLHKKPRALLSLANHIPSGKLQKTHSFYIPPIPVRLIYEWSLSYFNSYHFHNKPTQEHLSLEQFNNPLDKLRHWNRLYGKKGLIQFQAVFSNETNSFFLEYLINTLKKHKATPTLAVLKLFTHAGEGLLSFSTPGFSIAVDFVNNDQAHQAIKELNQFIVEHQGKIYLAKDLLLTKEQYENIYDQHSVFSELLKHYQSPMYSDLAKRLGIVK